MTDRPNLSRLIQEARAMVAAMTLEERAAMRAEQRENWLRAELNWPKAKFRMVDSVRIFDSYEDFCNG